MLLRGAQAGLYQVRWSAEIIAEVRAGLTGEAACSPAQADHLVGMMTTAFPEALVQGYEGLTRHMGNELGDRHVLAAAINARADVIVTDNLRHFPQEVCEPLGIEVQTADQFLSAAFDLAPLQMADAFLQQVDDFCRPSLAPADALTRLDSKLPSFARRLRTIEAVRRAAVLHRP
ncbi:MAG: PIN domain-containing protein [Actinomycetota bacterium]|nr:MAG: PIN domain-containing protein [Actinomycetota bacterium]